MAFETAIIGTAIGSFICGLIGFIISKSIHVSIEKACYVMHNTVIISFITIISAFLLSKVSIFGLVLYLTVLILLIKEAINFNKIKWIEKTPITFILKTMSNSSYVEIKDSNITVCGKLIMNVSVLCYENEEKTVKKTFHSDKVTYENADSPSITITYKYIDKWSKVKTILFTLVNTFLVVPSSWHTQFFMRYKSYVKCVVIKLPE